MNINIILKVTDMDGNKQTITIPCELKSERTLHTSSGYISVLSIEGLTIDVMPDVATEPELPFRHPELYTDIIEKVNERIRKQVAEEVERAMMKNAINDLKARLEIVQPCEKLQPTTDPVEKGKRG